MKATTPPRFCASARTCWHSVVLPDDSGPKISVIRPRGMPPTPIARSRAIDPVGIESTDCRSDVPSFMMEPRPNCFSIDRMAASTARDRSVDALSSFSTPLPFVPSATTLLVPVMVILVILLRPDSGPAVRLFLGRPRLVFVPARLALGLYDFHRLRRRLQQRFEMRLLALLGLGLLLLFLARAISRSHIYRLRGYDTLAVAASLPVHYDFAPACVSRLDTRHRIL